MHTALPPPCSADSQWPFGHRGNHVGLLPTEWLQAWGGTDALSRQSLSPKMLRGDNQFPGPTPDWSSHSLSLCSAAGLGRVTTGHSWDGGRREEGGTTAQTGGSTPVEQQPRGERLQEDTPDFWGFNWEDSFPFLSRHPSQSSHLLLRRCSPKGLLVHQLTDPERQVDSAQAELARASQGSTRLGWANPPAAGQPARKGRRKMLWAAGGGSTPRNTKCFVCSR